MKPFGKHSISYRNGYTLSILLSHLEGLLDREAGNLSVNGRGLRWKRVILVEEAIAKLTEAYDMGEEE